VVYLTSEEPTTRRRRRARGGTWTSRLRALGWVVRSAWHAADAWGRRRSLAAAIILLLPLLGAVGGLLVAALTPPRYTSHAYVLITDPSNSPDVSALNVAQAAARVATKPGLIGASRTLNQAAQDAELTSDASPDAPMVDLAATAGSADLAQSLADELARALSEHVSQFSSDIGVHAEIYARASLPLAPISPKRAVNALSGFFLGAVGSVTLYVLRQPRGVAPLGEDRLRPPTASW
jgi:capsular polysaccharide biosynthesis protein